MSWRSSPASATHFGFVEALPSMGITMLTLSIQALVSMWIDTERPDATRKTCDCILIGQLLESALPPFIGVHGGLDGPP